MILYTLVPFFIVSAFLLLAFAYGFRVSGEHGNVCSSMHECYAWTLQRFFNGSDETSDFLDILFGIIAIIILLNVLIAIVSEAWGTANDRAKYLFWKFRLQFLSEARFLSHIYRNLLSKGTSNKLGEYFDSFIGIQIVDRTPWTKHPYSLVKKKDEYDYPLSYFHPDDAEKIISSRSLQADLYWIEKVDGYNKKDGGLMVFITLANWFWKFIIYLVLLLCGFITVGWTWPLVARRYLLSMGMRDERGK